jgi:hypothetical protein
VSASLAVESFSKHGLQTRFDFLGLIICQLLQHEWQKHDPHSLQWCLLRNQRNFALHSLQLCLCLSGSQKPLRRDVDFSSDRFKCMLAMKMKKKENGGL